MYLILTIIFLFVSNIFPQQNGPDSISTLIATSGLSTISEGAIQLSWIYPGPNSLPENSKYYIQYSTFPEVSWSTSAAQVVFSTGPVYLYEEQVYVLTGLDNFVKSNNLDKETTFYFVIWISSGTDEILSEISNVATGWMTLWEPYVSIYDFTQGVHEGEVYLQFKGGDDYGFSPPGVLSGFWYIQYSTDEFSLNWSTADAQIKISTHTYPSYQWPAGFTVTGLSGGVTYYFRLWAEDDLGLVSEISDGVTVWAQVDVSPPKQITSISVISCGFKHVKLSWIFPYEDSYEDGFIYNTSSYTGSYSIRYRNDQPITDESLWSSATEVFKLTNVEIYPLLSSSTVITGLVNNTSYYFAIKVSDEKNQWSSVSSSSPFVKPFNSPPQCVSSSNHFVYDPVRNSTATIVSSTTVILDWTAAGWYAGYSDEFDSNYGDYVSSYTIQIATYLVAGNLGIPIISSYSIVRTSITISNLSEDTTYWWTLSVYDSESVSSTTVPFKFVVNSQNSAPLFPTNPLISPTTVWHTKTFSITFDWKDAYENDPYDFVVGYELFISTDPNFSIYVQAPADGLLATSYFVMNQDSTPDSLQLLPFENQKLYWYVVAYDSGAPFGYPQKSTQTPVGFFWINQRGEPPNEFEVYPVSSPVMRTYIVGDTTYYIVSSTPIILSWQSTTDPDPDYLDPYEGIKYEYIGEYVIFICSATAPYAPEPFFAEDATHWRTGQGTPSMFLSTSIVVVPPGIEPGVGGSNVVDLPVIENMTYYYRISARDASYVYSGPNSGGGIAHDIKETVSPSTASAAMVFIIDFTSEPPTGYDVVSPTGIINPSSLEGPILFSWTKPYDPDPFDSLKHYFLNITTVVPTTQDEWYTLPSPLWKINKWLSNVEITTASVMFTNLKLSPGVTYYWQVHCWGKKEWDFAVNPSTSQPWYTKPYGFALSTGSFCISNQKPYKFNLISPGTTTVVVPASGINTYRPTFYWEQVYDPDNYDPVVSSYVVVISSHQNFVYKFELYSPTTYLAIDFDLNPRTTYYWYVKAYDKFGNYQTPYTTFYFRTENFAPNEFNLYSPINDDIVQTIRPTFKFYNEADPDGDDIYYTIQYSSDSNFVYYESSGEFKYPSQKGSVIEILSPWGFEENKQYFWRVIAEDHFGGFTTSTIHSFWTNSVEESPTSFDINITSGVITQQNVLLTWQLSKDNDPKDYVSYYKICISTIPNYVVGISTYIVVYGSNTINYNLDLSILTENTLYQWWVEAYDIKGNYTKSISSYSFIVDLTTEEPDDIFLVSPGSSYTFVSVNQPLQLKWTAANKTEWWKPVNYKLHLAPMDTLGYEIIQISSGPYKNYTQAQYVYYSTNTLKENTTYFWYIQAENLKGQKMSTVYYFFVDSINDPPQPFNIISPTGTVTTRKPTFVWEQTYDVDDEIDKYELKFSTDKNFAVSVSTTVVLSKDTTSFTPSYKLLMNTTYYFKIRAYDNRGLWSESNLGQFYVPYFKPSSVEIISSTGVVYQRKPLLKWYPSVHPEPSSYITRYEVKIYSLKDSKLVEQVSTTTDYYQIQTSLPQALTYYFTITPVDDENILGGVTTGYFFVFPDNIPKTPQITGYNIDVFQPWLFNIYWEKVDKYTDGKQADDILGYNIYRAESYEQLLENVNNKNVYKFIPSSITFLSDGIYYSTYYYLIKVVTIGGVESEPSDIVTSYNLGSKIVLEPVGKILLSKDVDQEILSLGYEVSISTQKVVEVEQERFNVVSKYNLVVKKDGKPLPQYKFKKPVVVEISLPEDAIQNNQNLQPSMFYYNNIEYLFVNSQVDVQKKVISFNTTNTGEYTLRLVYPSKNIEILQIYPKKIFTPAEQVDNKIHFVINNPTMYTPEGEIYDINLRYIGKMKLENNELVWDGRLDNGELVPKGIYIYKIKVGEKVFTGTIIVAK